MSNSSTVSAKWQTGTQPLRNQHVPNPLESIDNLMLNLTNAIGHLSFEQKRPPLQLFSLPQEIQDIIFDLAYPTDSGFQAISTSQWEERETDSSRKYGHSYERRPFPSVKVNEFLVSKRFFLSAAKAFVSHQLFDDDFLRIKANSGDWGVIHQFLTKIEVTPLTLFMTLRSAGVPPDLKHMTINLSEHAISDAVAPRFVWDDELNSKDLMMVIRSLQLDRLMGLKSLYITSDHFYARRPAEEVIWQMNLRKLESLARALVTRPRYQKKVLSLRDAQALYPDSRVSMTGNTSLVEELISKSASQRMETPALRVHELPSDPEALKELIAKDGERVSELITNLKRRERRGRVGFML